jgi:hypothetical protein
MQLIVEQSYGIRVDEDTLGYLEEIYALDTTVDADRGTQVARIEGARELMIMIVKDPVNESMSGTLWLFPCAVSRLLVRLISDAIENDEKDQSADLTIVGRGVNPDSPPIVGMDQAENSDPVCEAYDPDDHRTRYRSNGLIGHRISSTHTGR